MPIRLKYEGPLYADIAKEMLIKNLYPPFTQKPLKRKTYGTYDHDKKMDVTIHEVGPYSMSILRELDGTNLGDTTIRKDGETIARNPALTRNHDLNRWGFISKFDEKSPEFDVLKQRFVKTYNNPLNKPYMYYELFDEDLQLKKQGGTMTKYQQGGQVPQQNIQDLVINLVQTAMDQQNPNSAKAMETINQIMEAAKAGDEKSIKLAQMIQLVIKLMLGQATYAKWGSKLQYLKSLKYARGGKTCPACMEKGGKSDSTLVNGKYPKHWTIEQKIKYEQEHPVDEAKVADEIHKTRLEEKNKNNKKVKLKTEKKACGGKTKKHYFGGWL